MNTQITTREQARQYAIDWQANQSDQKLTYGELTEQQAYLRELADKFDLVEEFTENGII